MTAGAVAAGPWVLAAWLAAGAFVATDRVTRRWRAAGVRRLWIGGVLLVPIVPLAAAGGRAAFAIGLILVTIVAIVPVRRAAATSVRAVWHGRRPLRRQQEAPLALAGLAASLGLMTGSLVVIERDSVASAAVVLALACCFDASRYLVGTGAPAAWEGAAAGVAAVGSAALCIAVVQPSPVTGIYPWVLGVVVVVGGLSGRALSSLWTPVARRNKASRPGPMARLATLTVAAPLWLVVTALGHI